MFINIRQDKCATLGYARSSIYGLTYKYVVLFQYVSITCEVITGGGSFKLSSGL
jgi:hypothetical protein